MPSLQRPVASAGFIAVGEAAAVELVAAADLSALFFIEDEDAVSLPDVVVVEAASAAYHSLTPWCPWHAPFFAAADVKLPSLHWPVVPAGALAGAAA